MGIKDQFAKFGAAQKNVQWSVSAFNEAGELVLSLWYDKDFLKKAPDSPHYIYTDRIDRWSGNGRNEMEVNLNKAWEQKSKIRAVLSKLTRSEDIEQVKAGADASEFPKTFYAKPDWAGELKVWNGTDFIIEFASEKKEDA